MPLQRRRLIAVVAATIIAMALIGWWCLHEKPHDAVVVDVPRPAAATVDDAPIRPTVPSPQPAPEPATAPVTAGKTIDRPAVVIAQPTGKTNTPDAPAAVVESEPPRQHLPSESTLLFDVGDRESVNVRAVAPLLQGDAFDVFADRLAAEAVSDPLAIDVGTLFKAAIEQARASPDGDVALRRLVCGRTMCVAALRASRTDAFADWTARFQANDAARPHAMGIDARTKIDDVTDYRLVFSVDPQVNGAGAPGRPQQVFRSGE